MNLKKFGLIATMLVMMYSLAYSLTVTQNFESGNMAIDVANGWEFHNILYDQSANYHIYGNYSGKNTKISSSAEDTWVKSPWVLIDNSGGFNFAMKLDETRNDPRGYVVYAIPYDKTKTNGEGQKIRLDSVMVTANANNTILPLTVAIPNWMIGKLYKIRLSYVGMGSGSKTSVDDASVPGKYYSNPANNNLPFDDIIVDTDNDGVVDADDQYPNDPLRAYNNYFPSQNSMGTLAFEDKWPAKGDYDFNDVVIDYTINRVTNAQNKVVEILAQFKLKASGASFNNGFGFQLDNVAPNKITSVSGCNYSIDTYITNSANGLESGQTYANCIVFDNFFNVMPRVGNGIGVNTEVLAPFVPYVTMNIKLTLINNGVAPTGGTVSINDLPASAFNFYIISDKRRGYEIHLADRLPTNKVDHTLFGTWDDASTGNRYYKTANNLPWGIDIVQGFSYPIEGAPLNDAYPKVIPWAESNGSLYTDWFANIPGYRVVEKIY